MNGQKIEHISKVLQPALPNYWELFWIGVGALVLIWLTFRVRAWFRDDDADAGRATDLLSDLRELHRQGGLSDEEFRLIKTRLVRGAAGEKSPPAASAETAGQAKASAAAAEPPPETP